MSQIPFGHISYLISKLRTVAEDNVERSFGDDDEAWKLGTAAALMNDAADVLEALLGERLANSDSRHSHLTLV